MNKKFLLTTIVLSIIIAITFYLLKDNDIVVFPQVVYIVAIVIAATSFLFGAWTIKAINERPALYVNRYMIGFIVQLMGFIMFIGAYLYTKPENQMQIVMALFVIYLIFKANMIVFLKKAEKEAAIKKAA